MSGATTLLKGPDATRKMGSVGRPMLGVELRLVDDRLEDVPPGVIGEIVDRGPMVMHGYLGRPDATCRRRLAGYKKPSAVHFVDELPWNGPGKVAKRRAAGQACGWRVLN